MRVLALIFLLLYCSLQEAVRSQTFKVCPERQLRPQSGGAREHPVGGTTGLARSLHTMPHLIKMYQPLEQDPQGQPLPGTRLVTHNSTLTSSLLSSYL